MERDIAAGQVLFGGIYGTVLSEMTRRRLAEGHLGGVILMGRNIETPEQVHGLLKAAMEATPSGLPAPLFGVDQEGGRVARLRCEPILDLPSARRLGEIGDAVLTRRVVTALGQQLRALGFTVDFAPVLDVDGGAARSVIGDRSYSGDPAIAAEHGSMAVAGFLEAGICPCGKHFPGHGATEHDSHVELPRVTRSLEEIGERELPPFIEAIAAGLPLIMPAHVVFDAFDDRRPATKSEAVLRGVLREQLGYEGVVITDDLVMGAVAEAGGTLDVAVEALMVGADLLLVCHDEDLQERLREHLAAAARRSAAVGRRLDEAVARTSSLRRRFTPSPIALKDLRQALTNNTVRDVSRALKGYRVT